MSIWFYPPLILPAVIGMVMLVAWCHEKTTWLITYWRYREAIRQHRREMQRL